MQSIAEKIQQDLQAEIHTQNVFNIEDDKTILVVEDDVSIGSMLVEALSLETPYHALHVTNGWQALQVVHDLKPCLFITDYRLPDLNGLELYDRLHATSELADVPALIMSAQLPVEEVAKRSLACLNKPFDLDDFLEKVEQLIA